MNLELKNLTRGIIDVLEIDCFIDSDVSLDVISKSKTYITGKAHSKADNIFISLNIVLPIVVNCDRCLDETSYEYNFVYDGEILKEDIEKFNLKKLVDEEIFLNNPTKVLCSDECKGLCMKCGINLNMGKCKCEFEPVSSPFDVLDSIFK